MVDFYKVYRGQDGNFDYDNPVAEMELSDEQVSIPDQDLPPDTIWHYIRRRVSGDCELESPDSPSCIVRIDSNGDMLGNIPNAPVNLIAEGLAEGKVKLRWRYTPFEEEIAPTGFYVYIDSGSGFDFGNPDAIVPYRDKGAGAEFNWTSEPLTHGEIYRFCVRSYRTVTIDGYIIAVNPELIPDCSGNYFYAGEYEGEPYCRRVDGAYFIWGDGVYWYISEILGELSGLFWRRTYPSIVGEYISVGSIWVSPTGHSDPDNKWTDETSAYDGNLTTYALNNGGDFNHNLVLTHDAISCDKIRIYCCSYEEEEEVDSNLNIDVYYGGAWHTILDVGNVTKNTWTEVSVGSTQTIAQARIKNNNPIDFYLKEFEFNQKAQGAAIVSEMPPYESQNTNSVSITADSIGPDAITNLIANVEEI
jgi:hypothetical protein